LFRALFGEVWSVQDVHAPFDHFDDGNSRSDDESKKQNDLDDHFWLPDASGHLDPVTGPVNEIPSLTRKTRLMQEAIPITCQCLSQAVRHAFAWVIHRCVLLV
jgi:hypothetical protein